MLQNIKKLLNIHDIIFIAVVLVGSLGLWLSFVKIFAVTGDLYAVVYYDNEEIERLSLTDDQTYTMLQSQYPDLLADLEIEVKDKSVRISKETSPNHICSKQGWSSSPIKPLVCLPNNVFVTIIAPNDSDVDVTIR